MLFILRSILSPSCRQSQPQYQIRRPFVGAAVKWVRDRALDHAVEKEKNLRPLINLKNLIKAEPSKSIPLSVIADNKESLGMTMRPADFVRSYRSVFEEFLPGGVGIHPHFRLTPEVLELDAEEQLIYQGETYQNEAADRLLKLLMLSRINKVPLKLIDRLKWDLGLPHDYVKSIIPQFPDYFQVSRVKNSSWMSDVDVLELVCWSSDRAISEIEKKALKGVSSGLKGIPVAFPLQYSTGFEMDKKMKKWVDDWQKLPYISPYENAMHLSPKSYESDKWVVAVMHELLHILVPKKTDKDNLLCFGEYMGLRSRFKRALLHHPGIFYISSKNRTHTVVLRDGYKRHLLIDEHQLMNMRNQYIHLMHTVKEAPKLTGAVGDTVKQQQEIKDPKKEEGEEEKGGISNEKEAGALRRSYSSSEEASDDDYDYTDDEGTVGYEEGEDDRWAGPRRGVAANRGKTAKKESFKGKKNPAYGKPFEETNGYEEVEGESWASPSRNVAANRGRTKDSSFKTRKNPAQEQSFEKYRSKTWDRTPPRNCHRKPEKLDGDNVSGKRMTRIPVSSISRGSSLPNKKTPTH